MLRLGRHQPLLVLLHLFLAAKHAAAVLAYDRKRCAGVCSISADLRRCGAVKSILCTGIARKRIGRLPPIGWQRILHRLCSDGASPCRVYLTPMCTTVVLLQLLCTAEAGTACRACQMASFVGQLNCAEHMHHVHVVLEPLLSGKSPARTAT